eukprot:COSAG02_NODE_5642_length_4160_cov_2.781335_5_plen_87_part_00
MGGRCVVDPSKVLNSLFHLGGEWRIRPGPDPGHRVSVRGSALLPRAFSCKPQRVWILPSEKEDNRQSKTARQPGRLDPSYSYTEPG